MKQKLPFIWDITLPPDDKKLKKVSLKDDSSQYNNIAEWLNIVALTRLTAELKLQRMNKKQAFLEGKISAQLIQSCIISLEEIQESLHFSFERNFTDEIKLPDTLDEEDWVNLDTEQEIWDGKTIDLAAIILEELAINLNPYPKKKGVFLREATSVETSIYVKENKEKQDNPFVVLKDLKLKK